MQAAQTAIDQQKIALQRQQTFGTDMQGFLANPSAKGVASLFGKYPEFAKQIGDSLEHARHGSTRLGCDAARLGCIAIGARATTAQRREDRSDAH
jgi:hypothetical protein